MRINTKTIVPLSKIQAACTAILSEYPGKSRGALLKLVFDRLESFNATLADIDKDACRVIVTDALNKGFKLVSNEVVIQTKDYTKVTGSGKLEQGRRFVTLNETEVPIVKQLEIVYAEFARHERRMTDSTEYAISKTAIKARERYSKAVYVRIAEIASGDKKYTEADKIVAKDYLAKMETKLPGDKRNQVAFMEAATTPVVNQKPETETKDEVKQDSELQPA